MNFDRLGLIRAADSYREGLTAWGDPPVALFCNGHVICLTDEPTPLISQYNFAAKVRETWGKFLVPSGQKLYSRRVTGRMGHYEREFSSEAGDYTVLIQERFARLFSSEAVWYGTAALQPVLVYEDSKLVGVVMPMKPVDSRDCHEPRPVVEVELPDDVVYHVCEDCE